MDCQTSFFVATGVAIVISILASHSAVDAAPLQDDSHRAHLVVEQADTFQGTASLFAVRACAAEDLTRAEAIASQVIGREEMNDIKDDVVVRVIDRDGRELSRHAGSTDVCGYARIAAAFVVASNRTLPGESK